MIKINTEFGSVLIYTILTRANPVKLLVIDFIVNEIRTEA